MRTSKVKYSIPLFFFMDRKKISQPFLQAWQEATTLRNTLNYFKAFRLNLLE